MENQPQSNPITQFVKGTIGMFINPDGSVSISKLCVSAVLALSMILYQNGSVVKEYIQSLTHQNSYGAYIAATEHEMDKRYNASLINQSQMIYSVVKPDMVGIFMYEPEDLHHFKKLVHYEGTLPEGKSYETFKTMTMGVDKTSEEYQSHLNGIPYHTNVEDTNSTKWVDGAYTGHFDYTCPIYNSKASYIGVLVIHWDKYPSSFDEKKTYVACTQSARLIGSYRD